MKKKICILMLGVMLFISGCTNGDDSQKEQDTQKPAVEQTDKKDDTTDQENTTIDQNSGDNTVENNTDDNEGKDLKQAEYESLQSILDQIDETVEMGTAGSSLKGVQAAALLMDWAAGTEFTSEEIQQATSDWLMPKGNDDQTLFANKMRLVDGKYQQLLTEGQEGILSDAGCTDCGYPWSNEPMEPVEAVMTAVGLR